MGGAGEIGGLVGWIFERTAIRVGLWWALLGIAHEEILRDRFGELDDWQKPEIQRSVGPCNQQVFDEFDARLDYILYECYQALLSANFSELEAIYTRGVQRGADIWDAWVDAFGSALGDLKKDKPHWAAGGFGHPEYMADFEYWGRMSNLYLHEAVSLSLGVEPEHLTDLWDDSYEVLGMIAPPLVLLKRRREQLKGNSTLSMQSRRLVRQSFLNG